jgi:hypothetical protein
MVIITPFNIAIIIKTNILLDLIIRIIITYSASFRPKVISIVLY